MRVFVSHIYLIVTSTVFLFFAPFALSQVRLPIELSGNQAGFGISAGDPFDVETGIYYRTYLELSIDDSIPIRFERTQRNQHTRSRSFGIGASTSYDMFII